ncbi:MAG: 23S rRNA (adenine(2503)-C(2))-methyltransferase RlmN [Candidatus Omnitrophica bacterium]|nr:23S rRNA (adenine(2503)-C(2))-methyltransferase RlmN [Candidatus Omnitrophota bacterium]MCF7878559.1 23S rRNA (adenine(2503)-C(2))-methyltransferase RlmN [Candidatus Omnitrophota bacterium]
MECIYNLSLKELQEKLILKGFSRYSAKQIFAWVYKEKTQHFSLMTNIAKGKREELAKMFSFLNFKILKREKSKDGTQKYLFQLADQETIETVMIPEKQRNTLCVSTQVGCSFNCKFCASKIGGLIRNLSPAEIVNQYLQLSSQDKITNIVFMGIGEPLDNFKNVVKAIKILTEPAGINFTNKRISISTCGLSDKIKELVELNLGIKLSLSLHAAVDEKRTELMPVNKKHTLADLIDAVKYYSFKQKHPVTFEYILLDNFNTTSEDARKLAKLVKTTGAKLNLIPYNQTEEKLKTPQLEKVEAFKKKLKEEKVIFTLRKQRGFDINAACGQLRSFSKKAIKK